MIVYYNNNYNNETNDDDEQRGPREKLFEKLAIALSCHKVSYSLCNAHNFQLFTFSLTFNFIPPKKIAKTRAKKVIIYV